MLVGHQRGEAEQHDDDLEDLDADQDRALADAVGQVAGRSREKSSEGSVKTAGTSGTYTPRLTCAACSAAMV